MNNIRRIILITLIVFLVLLSETFFYNYKASKNNLENEEISNIENNITTYNMNEQDIKNLPSKEIKEQTMEQEQLVSKEQEGKEAEGFRLQGNIAYNGAKGEKWNVELGNYIGLTYYSQLDSRWANKMYSSVNNSKQTIGTSGCGPACASMIVTATRGTITPDKMGDLFVKYGYRSANNGTYFSAFRAIADEFNIEYEETYYLDKAIELLKNNHYVIASCGNGLFTTGGHFVVLVGIEENIIKIYDPYLYSGKFDTSTRKGKVTVENTTVYCSIENFKKYANYSCFFAFKHDANIQENKQIVKTQPYTRYVNAKIGLNIRNKPNGNIVGSCNYGTEVKVYETNGNWSKIGTNKWVYSSYLTEYELNNLKTIETNSNIKYSIGNYKVNTYVLNVRYGPGTKYKAKSYSELTMNARKQNEQLGNKYTNGLKRGVITTVTQIQDGFGKIPSGWICLKYCKKI